MTYEQNIQRLSRTSQFNTSQAQQFETENANNISQWHRNRAEQTIQALSKFSATLQKERKKQIERAKAEGEKIYAEDRAVDAKRLLELKMLEPKLKADDIRHHELKAIQLRLEGVNAYPDADRIAKLSHYQQFGYARAKLKNRMDSFPDTLNYRMQNGTTKYQLNGIEYTAKDIRNSNVNSYVLKQALLHAETAKLKEEMGLNNFTPELLELVGVNKTIEAAKTAYLSKARTKYNIEASKQTQAQAMVAWNDSPKTGMDIQHFLTTWGATVNEKNELNDNEGAWNAFMSMVAKEANGEPDYADTIGNVPIPLEMAKKVGAKPGTTFAEHWPQRFSKLKKDIKKGYVDSVNAQKDFLKAKQTEVGNIFNEEASKGEIDGERLEWYREQSRKLGGVLDTRIKNYETVSARDQRIDEETNIPNLIASNNGSITHQELNQFHPRAAAKFRDQATRHENAFKKKHNVDGKIKAALNQSWTDAGMKSKEKPVVWEYALARATADYERKFNKLVAIGFDADSASKLALDSPAGGVKHPETGEPITDFEGVVNEIKTNGANSKYTKDAIEDKDSLADAMIRVHQIDVGKREMIEDPFAVKTKIVGGEYGKDRINEIIKNIEIYGPWEGVIKSDLALKYYQGLALGKRGWNAHGIIDSQLKAAGHPGLFPDRVEPDPKEDDDGAADETANVVEETKYEGSLVSYNNIIDNSIDLQNRALGRESVHNQPENIASYLA